MKQRKALDEDSLMLIPRPLTFKGANKNWYHDMAKHEDWTGFNVDMFVSSVPQQPLISITCPLCLESIPINCLKLSVRSTFSNLKCPKCKVTNSTRKWACECGELWYKCHTHYRINNVGNRFNRTKLKRKCPERGYDFPLPKFRKINHLNVHAIEAQGGRNEWRPPPGSTLALRFPHLVKGAAPT